MTYMASCGDTPCDQYDPTNAQWFKIAQYGLKPDGNTWYQADTASMYQISLFLLYQKKLNLSILGRDAYDVTIPQDLAPGGYLMRHEVRTSYNLVYGYILTIFLDYCASYSHLPRRCRIL
jgi:hypothetical protein